ncbi:MAG TPA: DegT/DnrJ/EryC1/StrS family aminotransferase [Planctomycetaceae bacterium]|nr:DegT/DnrJ/EryC1/StrS family aminotransferase [Planctomycetaceae bacterium]
MIKAFDYRRGHERLRDEIDAAVQRVLASGRLLLGPEGEAFEGEFAAWAGSRHGVAVGSGTDAIVIALKALGVGAGDEVITVSHTAVPTVSAIREVWAVPRFIDVEDDTLLMDPRQIESAIGPRTRAIVLVHLYGRPARVPEVLQIARRHNLCVIEDCAQAHGARIDGRHVGTFGDVGCFSFYPTKNLGAYGDGGLCVTGDPLLAERMRRLRFYGFDGRRVSQMDGINSRMDELQAAILRVKLRHLDESLQARRALAARYLKRLASTDLRLPAIGPRCEHAWHLFVVRTCRRAEIIAALQEADVEYGIHYPHPIHLMPAFERFGGGAGSLPVTERAAGEVLSLPLYAELTMREVRTVCSVLADAWALEIAGPVRWADERERVSADGGR